VIEFRRRNVMDREELMALFNKHPRIGTLSTANKLGDVNVAVFGSPRMIDENTVVMGIGENRSFRNLQRNPKAVFIVMRVYLEAVDIETSGEFYDQMKHDIAMAAGQQAADMIHAAIRFGITELRPIVDLG
jgi:hypothetical protein